MVGAPLSLKARALQWLAQREHSRVELRRKLMRLARERAAEAAEAAKRASDGGDGQGDTKPAAAAAAAATVDGLLDWLVANRYLSDARFVESRVNARAARYGNLRIRQELGQHGTALDAATAERLKGSEMARAQAMWTRRYGATPALDASERARQMRFLAGRGFSAEVIRRVVRGAEIDSDEHA
jgi:regulatory protein